MVTHNLNLPRTQNRQRVAKRLSFFHVMCGDEHRHSLLQIAHDENETNVTNVSHHVTPP